MVSTNFGATANHEELALSAGATRARTPRAGVVWPLRGANPSTTCRLGLGKRPCCLWQPYRQVTHKQPKCHLALPIIIIILLFIPQLIIFLVFKLLIINRIIIFIAQIILFFIQIFLILITTIIFFNANTIHK